MSEATDCTADVFCKLRHCFEVLLDGNANDPDFLTRNARDACAELLQAIEGAQVALDVQPVARAYRDHFSINYRRLFPDDLRRYQLDILTAALQEVSLMMVNGEMCVFDGVTLRFGQRLRTLWGCLLSIAGTQTVSLPELRALLHKFDAAWARFEEAHIVELMRFEERGRQPLLQAADLDAALRCMEVPGGVQSCGATLQDSIAGLCSLQGHDGYRQAQQDFVESVSNLTGAVHMGVHNTAAIEVDVLSAALRVHGLGSNGAHLSRQTVATYLRLRLYLQEARTRLCYIDPQLRENARLVKLLEELEFAWDLGAFLKCSRVWWSLLDDLLGQLRGAAASSSCLQQMHDDRSALLFLVLPRLVWIWILTNPRKHAELLGRILPRHIGNGSRCDLEGFFKRWRSLIWGIRCCGVDNSMMRPLFLNAALEGPGCPRAAAHFPPLSRPVQDAFAEFLIALEAWSMDLQRAEPSEWNRFAALLIVCIDAANSCDIESINMSHNNSAGA
jgi:hypothetical protein